MGRKYDVLLLAAACAAFLNISSGGSLGGQETPVETCDDGEDNDQDGDIDCADADCAEDAACEVGPFLRGDCNGNGFEAGPLSAIVLLNFAFRGGPEPPCLAACDAEANGTIDVTDVLRNLRHVLLGVGQPDPPFPDCTTSTKPSDNMLGCVQPLECF